MTKAQLCNRRYGVYLGIAPVLLLLAWHLSNSVAGVNPTSEHAILRIEGTESDLGTLRVGSTAEAIFVIRNDGAKRLILRQTNGDCDCLSAHQAELIVEPGGRRNIVVELDTIGISGEVKIGIHYLTNDPQRQKLSLFCIANVQAEP